MDLKFSINPWKLKREMGRIDEEKIQRGNQGVK
jgi:hypothetical protein